VPVKIVSGQASPDIVCVARLGLAARPETAPAKPLYLKEPDVTVAGKPEAGPVAEGAGASGATEDSMRTPAQA
jgi:hypothetical protein